MAAGFEEFRQRTAKIAEAKRTRALEQQWMELVKAKDEATLLEVLEQDYALAPDQRVYQKCLAIWRGVQPQP